MKKFLWAGLIGLAAACGRNTFEVDGTYTAPDGTRVYLIDLEKKDTLGTTEVKGNAFTFEGEAKEPFYAYVGKGRERVRFILEPGKVAVDLDERTAGGSPMTDTYNAFHRRFYALDDAAAALLADSLVRVHPDDLVGALAMEDLSGVDTAAFNALYPETGSAVREFSAVESAHAAIEASARTRPGQPFSDYLIPGGHPDGTDVRLSDYIGKGKFILLDHWASWCGPCKREMPYVKKVYETFKGDRFDVVGIAVSDKREDSVRAVAEWELPWTQILDAQRLPREHYGIAFIPHIILFGPDGTILARGLRGEDIYEAVRQALQ